MKVIAIVLFSVLLASVAAQGPGAYQSPEWFAATGQPMAIESDLGRTYAQVLNSDTALETPIVTGPWLHQDNMKWYIRPSGTPGWYYFQSALRYDVVMSQLTNSQSDEAPVTLWTIGEYPNEMVRFEPSDSAYNVIFMHSNMALTAQGATTENPHGVPLTQSTLVPSQSNQLWRFAHFPAYPSAPQQRRFYF